MIERPNRRGEPVSRLPATARAIGCLVTTFAPKSSSTETGLSTTTRALHAGPDDERGYVRRRSRKVRPDLPHRETYFLPFAWL